MRSNSSALPSFAYRALVATALAVVGPACAILPIPGLTNAGGGSTGRGTWDGPECKRALYQLDELGGYDYNAKPTTKDFSPEAQVLLQVCVRREKPGYADHIIPQHPRIDEIGEDRAWLAQDDRHLDVVSAAVFAVAQAARNDDPSLRGFMYAPDVGVALFFTRVISPEMLAQGLASVQVPPGAKNALIAMYRAVPAKLAGVLGDDQRQLLVDVPVAVYQDRRAHYAAFHALYDQFDRLHAEAISQDTRDDPRRIDRLAAALTHLRSAFFAACGKIECRAAPLYANATRDLAQLYVVRGDVLAARTESYLYSRDGSYVGGLAQAVYAAQEARLRAMEEAWAKYRRAKDNGSDEVTARRLAGDVPAQRPDIRIAEVKLALPNYAAAIDDDANAFAASATVARVGGGGATRTLVFEVDHTQYQDAYDCQQTNRITRIHRDGTIEYEENCKYRTAEASQLQHAPVAVPASEAAAIRPGDIVSFMTSGNRALIVEVHRGKNVVQVRGDHVR